MGLPSFSLGPQEVALAGLGAAVLAAAGQAMTWNPLLSNIIQIKGELQGQGGFSGATPQDYLKKPLTSHLTEPIFSGEKIEGAGKALEDAKETGMEADEKCGYCGGYHGSTCGMTEEPVTPEEILRVVNSLPSRDRWLVEFTRGIRGKLSGAAGAKGYARNGGDGTPLYDFVSQHVGNGGDAHALGEIIYKTVEAANRSDLRQNLMVKVAAWAFLVWEAEERGK